MDKCVRLSNCVCVCVCVCTHDGESVSVSLEASGSGGQLARLCLGILQACSPPADIWRLSEQQRRTTMQLQCITQSLKTISSSALPSPDVPVSFILMVRKSLSCDKTGSILDEGSKWQRRLAAAAAAALDESKRLLIARGLLLKDVLWDFWIVAKLRESQNILTFPCTILAFISAGGGIQISAVCFCCCFFPVLKGFELTRCPAL